MSNDGPSKLSLKNLEHIAKLYAYICISSFVITELDAHMNSSLYLLGAYTIRKLNVFFVA